MMVRLRLLLLVAGVVAFSMALRGGVEWLRWVGIVLVAAALLLRFVKRRQT
jgi:protein-S-isoprenylcysteine O-methyltransferase Ste14